jgi:hypothetical protein
LVHFRLVGKAVPPKLNFGSLSLSLAAVGGWQVSDSEKQHSEVRAGPPLGAKALASRSKIQKWSVTQTANI